MAENKKSVIIYTDWGSIYNKLTDEEAGRLVKMKMIIARFNNEHKNCKDVPKN